MPAKTRSNAFNASFDRGRYTPDRRLEQYPGHARITKVGLQDSRPVSPKERGVDISRAVVPAIHSDTFSLPLYQETLQKANELGYAFPTVSELKDGTEKFERFLLLRHDVDSSPRHALAMAQLEHRLGIRSSFFILMHCPFYNPGAPPHWDDLRAIVDMGFEVGLHYDTQFFEQRGIDPLEGVLDDVAAMEKILRIRVRSVSQHRPASGTFLKQLNKFYVDAYNSHLINDVCYISDS